MLVYPTTSTSASHRMRCLYSFFIYLDELREPLEACSKHGGHRTQVGWVGPSLRFRSSSAAGGADKITSTEIGTQKTLEMHAWMLVKRAGCTGTKRKHQQQQQQSGTRRKKQDVRTYVLNSCGILQSRVFASRARVDKIHKYVQHTTERRPNAHTAHSNYPAWTYIERCTRPTDTYHLSRTAETTETRPPHNGR